MNKGKKSIINAVTALSQMIVICVVGLVLNKTIIMMCGSDYNGINSTVTQVVNALMVLEGGFTLASNVALFSPFSKGDTSTVNEILAATNIRFRTVGIIALLSGGCIAFLLPLVVTSEMPKWMIIAIMFTALLPACFNLGITMKYRLLILTDQKEYVISIITTISNLAGSIFAVIALMAGKSLLIARVIIMISFFLNYIGIIVYSKRKYPSYKYSGKPSFEKIKGTWSVLIMKLTSMFYLSFPIIVIATLPVNGAALASVYAVYRAVMTVVSNSLSSLINAPRLGFGALFAENRIKDAEKYFQQYELITCVALSSVLGATGLLLMPFVELYTTGITDINYIDNTMAIIMLLTIMFEIIHIPSGQMIQMKGDFTASRRIQSIACIVLVVSMGIARLYFGLYGIIAAVLFAAIIIAGMEIVYTGRIIFKRKINNFLKNVLPCIVVCGVMTYIGLSGVIHFSSYLSFAAFGGLLFIGVVAITFIAYGLVDYSAVKEMMVKIIKTIRQ